MKLRGCRIQDRQAGRRMTSQLEAQVEPASANQRKHLVQGAVRSAVGRSLWVDRHRVPKLSLPGQVYFPVRDSRQTSPLSTPSFLLTIFWGPSCGEAERKRVQTFDCVLESRLGLARQWSPGKR